MQAITVAIMLNNNTAPFVRTRNCLSENLCPKSGFTRFSEKMAAGASIAELVVLIIADNNDPKNKICIVKGVCRRTIFGSASCVSPANSCGYRCLMQRLMNSGNIAIVRYNMAPMYDDQTAVRAEPEDIAR